MMWVMDDWIDVGPHRYHLDGDMLFWCPSGEILPAHVDAVCTLLRQITNHHGYALWLVDALRSIPVGYESRRRYAHWLTPWQGALFGAAFRAPLPARTTAHLTLRAVRMRSSNELYIENFDTEAAARSYLAEHAKDQLRSRNAGRAAGSS